LLSIVAAAGDPWFGAAVFGAFWLGRALSVWLAPVLLHDPRETHMLLKGIAQESQKLKRVHGAALAGVVIVLVWWLAHGSSWSP
jgi:hypothetical protein